MLSRLKNNDFEAVLNFTAFILIPQLKELIARIDINHDIIEDDMMEEGEIFVEDGQRGNINKCKQCEKDCDGQDNLRETLTLNMY